MPSIKVLNIALVLLCILITAFLCTFLAISSSDVALKDTKESRDTSVDTAFAVGEESVRNRTEEYSDLLLSGTVDFVQQFLLPLRLMATSVSQELMANPYDDVKRWEFHNQPRYYWAYYAIRDKGSSGLSLYMENRLYLTYYEDSLTADRGPDEYHHYMTFKNRGDDSPGGGYEQSSSGSVVHPTGETFNGSVPPTSPPCANDAAATNGSSLAEHCRVPLPWGEIHTTSLYTLSAFVPAGLTLWTPPLPVSSYLVVSAYAPLHFNGIKRGTVISSADLRHVSNFLRKIVVGGPVAGHPSRGRVFITLRESWLDPTSVGTFIGASKGSVLLVTGEIGAQTSTALRPINSSDDIIRQVGILTTEQQTDFEGVAMNKSTVTLNITTEYAPQGEDFFFRVSKIVDAYGINWFVNILIDREYILGSIDRKTRETKDAIRVAEKKVEDDLKTARTILYTCVVAVAVVLILISVVFVLGIIKPLLALERDMAMVAVMKLEHVDREQQLSSLEEVRLMQGSFLQMMTNLIEYRNYMPASVLQDEDSESDEDSKTESRKKSSNASSAVSQSMRSQSTRRVAAKQTAISGTEARQKRVTLLVCNVVKFLDSVKDVSAIPDNISRYLTMTLLHIKSTKGIPDSFSGDRLYVSWNGVRPCSSHKSAAYLCATHITKDTSLGRQYSVGIVSGDIKCGNMGCDGMKKFTFIGSLSSWIHIVERVGRGLGSTITIDQAASDEIVNIAYVRFLQHVTFRKHSPKVLILHQTMKSKDVAEEEWMYQLEEGANNDPNKHYNASYVHFMAGEIAAAKEELGKGNDDDSIVMKNYREKLNRAVSDPSVCEPYGSVEALLS